MNLTDLTLGQLAGGFLTLTAVLAAIGVWRRKIGPAWRGLVATLVGVRDAILGRDAVIDSITRKEISPAVPGMGVRMAHQEEQMSLVTQTLATLVEQQAVHMRLERRVDRIEGRVGALEEGAVERIVTRAESARAWGAVEAVAEAAARAAGTEPPPPPEPDALATDPDHQP